MLESFFQEITILSYCKHPNIVKLLHSSFDGTLMKESREDLSMRLRNLSMEQSSLMMS